MVERNKIAIVFWGYNTNWIGGTYYIINTIKGFNLLSDSEKPEIVILSSNMNDYQDLKKETLYPYLTYSDYPTFNIFERIVNKIHRRIFNGNSLFIGHLKDIRLFLYNPILYTTKNKPIYWIPDFQEHYLPEMFQKDDIRARKAKQLKLSQSKQTIVFSSKNALEDFKTFFPNNNNTHKLIRFAVFHPALNLQTHSQLLEKYNITKPYFIVPNQFWKHKNHLLLLKAIQLLKKDDGTLNYQFVFTGSTNDNRNKNHFDTLLSFVKENSISDNIRFLGFIPLDEMLILAKKSIALIQPSLFEGWSTVVEDGKSLNLPLILSDLEVHKEQTTNYPSLFFNPHSESDLYKVIKEFINHPNPALPFQYLDCQQNFAKSLKNLLSNEPIQ